ncbi:hypothetical protein ABZ454_35845 [Streptomyces sp. NPDC005803]|uniref:hypothetical protein n=1 Tax=Streptomyces sp. NPDC005803 TaxID=3154297 RepID=UPI0033D6C724
MRRVRTDVTDRGEAAAAGTAHVVPDHLAPADPAPSSDGRWATAVRASARSAGYRGRITVGHALMRIPLA